MQIVDLVEQDVVIKAVYPLYDVNNDRSYDLYEFENGGFAIATHQNAFVSEVMIEGANPYKDDGYLRRVNDDVSILWNDKNTKNLFLDEKNSFTEIREANTEMLSKKVSVISTYGDNIWRGTSESRFSRYKNWINTNNTCGPHAAAVILAYSDDYIDDRIVPSTIRTKGSTSPGNLISKLIQNTTNATATRPTDVSNGMWSIISMQAGLYYSVSSQTIGGTWDRALRTINGFGSPYGNHWVVAYQYKEDSCNKGYFKCYDNHGSYTATVHASWRCGLV